MLPTEQGEKTNGPQYHMGKNVLLSFLVFVGSSLHVGALEQNTKPPPLFLIKKSSMVLQILGLTSRTLKSSIPLLTQDNKSSHKLETEKEIKRSSFPIVGMLHMNSGLEGGGEDIPHLQAFPGKRPGPDRESIPSRLYHGTVNMEILLLYSLVSILFPVHSTATIS